jgi:hypothetical protein
MAGFSSSLFLGQSVGVAVGALILDRAGAVPVFAVSAVAWPTLAVWLALRIGRR